MPRPRPFAPASGQRAAAGARTGTGSAALGPVAWLWQRGPREADFDWTARQTQGQLVRGRSRANGVHQVRAQLRRQGLVPLTVAPVPPTRQRPIGSRDVVLFTRQLATLLGAGIALQQALQIVREGLEHPRLAALIGQVLADIEAGLALSSALRRHPQVFATVYVHLVEAGEASGQLDVLLLRLAADLEKGGVERGLPAKEGAESGLESRNCEALEYVGNMPTNDPPPFRFLQLVAEPTPQNTRYAFRLLGDIMSHFASGENS